MGGFEALRQGAAWRDLSARGRLQASGEDRARLLHAISSNVVEGLTLGQGTYAFFLNAQGRIQSDSRIFVDRDRVLIDCEAGIATRLRDHIDSYIIMDDVSLEDVGRRTALIGLAGPSVQAIVDGLGLKTTDDPLTFARTGRAMVIRSPAPGVEHWILLPSDERPALLAGLEESGATRATEREWEHHRVRNWVPRFGFDFGPRNIPHETLQFNAVSFSKGCYTGQEIVERVRSRGAVRRQLVGIELDATGIPDDLAVRHDGTPVGELTSPTPAADPAESARGFAIVRSSAAAAGTIVDVGGTAGRVVDVGRS